MSDDCIKVSELYNLEETIAAELFGGDRKSVV